MVHVPLLVETPHDLPGPQDATPQQKPSVQNRPVGHGAVVLHAEPSPGAGTHVLMVRLQMLPAAQSALLVHEVLHAVAPHRYLSHDLGTSLQTPAPSHVLAWVSVPELQVAAPHDSDAGG